jgi:hypothetical protein
MKYRVKITQAPKYNVKVKMPEAKTGMQVEGSLYNQLASFGGADAKDMVPKTEVRKTITKVPREEANLEAEGGETVLTFDAAGYPLFYEIKGPRHSNNGVPLNLPDDSFIFSDTRSMKVNDQEILDMFGLSKKKGGYTPADISKKYLELNKYREILQSPDSDKIAKASAERMIKNMIIKLGGLAVAQESKKGFPQGIPAVARPYMEAYGIAEEELVPQQPEEGQEQMMPEESPMQSGVEQIPPTQGEQEDMMQQMPPEMMEQAPMAMYGAVMGGYNMPFEYADGGYLPKAAAGAAADREKTLAELQKEANEGKANPQKVKVVPQGNQKVVTADGRTLYGSGTIAEAEDYSNIRVQPSRNLTTNPAQYERDICTKIAKSKKPIEFAIANGWISASRKSEFEHCVDAQAVEATRDKSQWYELEEEPVRKKHCECVDPVTGEIIISEPDANGECAPCSNYEQVETEQETYEVPEMEQRGTVFPEDVAAFASTLGYRLPRKDPMAVGPRGTQYEQYGLDPRGLSNSYMASSNAGQRAITQIMGSTPAAALAAQYQGQKAAAEGIKGAFDQANKFNTDTRNQEILGNTQMRQNFLDKDAVYKLDYDQKLAQQAQNQARNYNAKLAESMNKLQQMSKNASDLALVNESMKWKAYDPVTKKMYQKQPWELKEDPTAVSSGALAQRTTEIMRQNPDISDATAYKIAMQEAQISRLGGATMFKDGGYIYTVFPAVTL